MTCPRCGAPLAVGAAFCGRCGSPVAGAGAPAPDPGPEVTRIATSGDGEPGFTPPRVATSGDIQPPVSAASLGASRASDAATPPGAERDLRYAAAAASAVPQVPSLAGPVCPRCKGQNEPGSRFCYRCGLPLSAEAEREAKAGAAELPLSVAIDESRYGGFWARLLAWFIDAVIVLAIQFIPIAYLFGDGSPVAKDSGAGPSLLFLLILSAPAFYHTIAVAGWGTTVGKRALGLRVVGPEGAKPGLGRAFARWLALAFSLFIFFPILLVVAFDSQKRGLHDMICDTRVVRRQAGH